MYLQINKESNEYTTTCDVQTNTKSQSMKYKKNK